MRLLGVLLIVIGLGVGAVWPWAQGNFFNDEITRVEMENLRENGSAEAILELQQSDNPVRVRFVATFEVDGKLPPVRLPLFAKISDRQGTLISGTVSFATNGLETGPELPKQRGSQPLNVTVVNDGLHALSLSFAPNRNDGGIERPDIKTVTAIFVRNARAINDEYSTFGFILAAAGFYVLVRSRRQKRSEKITFGRDGNSRE